VAHPVPFDIPKNFCSTRYSPYAELPPVRVDLILVEIDVEGTIIGTAYAYQGIDAPKLLA